MERKSMAERFIEANTISPVISGYAKGAGGEGGVFTLADGSRWNLSAKDCEEVMSVPGDYPRWHITVPA